MTEEATPAPEAEAVAQAANDAGLSLQDISACVQVIDVVSQRGAIRGNELQAVGTLREKLVGFLKAAQENGQPVDIPGEENADEAQAETAAEAAEAPAA
jgi:hypothetical protein